MIDIHSHIVPAVDDGVQTIEEAFELLRMEQSGGTTFMFATPHVYGEADYALVRKMAEHVATLNEAVRKEGIEVEVIQGAEVFPAPDVPTAIRKGLPLTLGDKKAHILLDLPFGAFPPYLEDLVFNLKAMGIVPILAHPERTGPVQQSLAILHNLLKRGAVCQVNAGSLRGKYGPAAQEVGYKILELQWASFLASDAHRPGKGPQLASGRDFAADHVDPGYLQILTTENGRAVMAGTPLVPVIIGEEPPSERRSFFQRLFRK